MIIHLLRPRTTPTSTDERLSDFWQSFAAVQWHEVKELPHWFPGSDAGIELLRWENRENEGHPQLLARVWKKILDYQRPPDSLKQHRWHLITEEDFIPFDSMLERLEKIVAVEHDRHAVFVPWNNRTPEGKCRDYWPMIGPWFMLFDAQFFYEFDAPKWFDSIDRPYDVAVPVMMGAIHDGVAGPDQMYTLPMKDHYPETGFTGIEYPGIGVHCFYQRCFACAPDSKLGMLDTSVETVGGHRAKIARILTNLREGRDWKDELKK